MQALAVTIDALDAQVMPMKSSADFLSVFDGLLGEIANMAEVEASGEIHAAVQVLRGNLDIALKQAKDARWGHQNRN